MPGVPPLVSVILPTYNRAAFLREAIDSVLAQTWQRWELIVVDDGSTDGTRPYLATLADPRIHVLELAHDGNRARLRNRGMTRARGEYLAFLDSDDFWIPTKLERQVTDLIARHRRWGYAHYRHVDDAGASLPIPRANEWTACDG
jgi:glycosyltransferase involved in cell wall biosynthesis